MRARFKLGIVSFGWLAVANIAGCGRRPAAPTAAAQPLIESCALGPRDPAPDRLTVVFTEPLIPGHPTAPATRASEMVFRHLYEPLVRLTCDGRIVSAAAESWVTDDGGRSWTFTLRHNLRFWDGSGVPPQEIIDSWAGTRTPDQLVPWAGIQRARVVDDRRIAVYMVGGSPAFPRVLADIRLSLAVRTRISPWPLGTGMYRPAAEGDSSLTIETWNSGIRRPAGAPDAIEFRSAGGRTARDLLDKGLDVLVTDDSSLNAYAVARGNYRDTPLSWDRLYLLFVPRPGRLDAPVDVPGPGFLEAVARDAIGREARVAEGPRAWQPEACPTGPSLGVDPDNQPRRVVYSSDDETARELAHRLVTYAGTPGQGGDWLVAAFRQPADMRTFPFAVGLEPAAWTRALTLGNETAYVVGLPARGSVVCSRPLRTEGDWLPLIETRAHLAVRAGVGGLYADMDGIPHAGEER